MKKRDKLLLSALVVGALGTVAALGVFGAFSATTQNAGNEISTGTVALSDNDGGSALVNVTGARPGDSWTRCIKVTYNGSLPAVVHSWTEGGLGPLNPYVHLTLSQGTQASSTFPSCAGFTPDSVGTFYDGPAPTGGTGSFETGFPEAPAGQSQWHTGDTLVIKSVATIDSSAPNSLQNSTTGPFTIMWEARDA
jgi:hypothetical protein